MVFAVRYLWEHAEMILMQLLFCCVFAVVFYLYHLPLAAVMYQIGRASCRERV